MLFMLSGLGSHILIWEPTHGGMDQERASKTMVKILMEATGAVSTGELSTIMGESVVWRVLHRNCLKQAER